MITGQEKPGALPEGFRIMSVADQDDVDQRRMAKSIAFFGGYYAPSSWLPAATMREMQRAPDYRSDLDLFINASNGDATHFAPSGLTFATGMQTISLWVRAQTTTAWGWEGRCFWI